MPCFSGFPYSPWLCAAAASFAATSALLLAATRRKNPRLVAAWLALAAAQAASAAAALAAFAYHVGWKHPTEAQLWVQAVWAIAIGAEIASTVRQKLLMQ